MINYLLGAGMIIIAILGGGNRVPALALYCILGAAVFWAGLNKGIIRRNSLHLPLMALLMTVVFSMLYSLRGGFRGFIFLGVLSVTISLIYIFSSLQSDELFNIITSVIIILSASLGVFISSQGILQREFFAAAEFLPSGNFPNHNLASGFMVVGLVTAVTALLFNRNSNKALLACCCALIVTGMLFAFSRGAWISLFSALLIIVFFKTRNVFKFALSFALILSVLAAAFFLLPESFSGKWFSHKFFTSRGSTRSIIWNTSVNAFKAKPLTGWGHGSFEYVYHRFKLSDNDSIARYGKYTRFAHNEYLNFAVEAGLPGVAALLWVIALTLYLAYQKAKICLTENPESAWKYIASLAAITAVSAHSFFDFNLHFPIILFAFSFFAGFSSVEEKPAAIPKFIYVLRPACFIIILASICAALSYEFGQKADSLNSSGKTSAASSYYKIAVSLNPLDANLWRKAAYLSEEPESRAIISDALFFNPSDSFLHQDLARSNLKRSDLQNAFSEYISAMELNPNNPFFYSEAGEVFLARGWLKDSLKYFRKAAEIEPFFAFAHFRAGQIYEKLGDKKNALKEFKMALNSEKYFNENPYDNYTKMLVTADYSLVRKKINEIKK